MYDEWIDNTTYLVRMYVHCTSRYLNSNLYIGLSYFTMYQNYVHNSWLFIFNPMSSEL